MRITAKFATAGEKGLASMPTVSGDGWQFARADGMLDEAKARRALADTPGIQFSSNDNSATIAFTVELLVRMKQSFSNLASARVGFSAGGAVGNGHKTTCERRMERGSVAFVRIDVRSVRGGIRARVSTANPRSVVGGAELMARYAAQAFTDNAVAIRDDAHGDGSAIDIEEGEGCAGMVSEAERRNAAAMKRAEKKDCRRRINGYCSPCDFGCVFHENGRCGWK